MGLEMFSMHSQVLSNVRASAAQLEETNRRLAIGMAVMVVYLAIGAAVFVSIEAPLERIEMETYMEYREQWMERFKAKGFQESEIDQLINDVREAALHGVWSIGNQSADPHWSFGRAFFFAGSLVSTVGYGRMSPRTEAGKLFTIVYCCIGIPLTLALLSAVVARLKQPSAYLRGVLNAKLGSMFHSTHIQIFHLLSVCGLLVVFVFCIPAWFFATIEDDWSFLDAFYYCFVSLTTIGLGDYEPGDSASQAARGIYKILATVYLLAGLCCMMLFLATLYDMPQLNITRFFLAREDYDEEEEKRKCTENGSGPSYGRHMNNDISYDNGFYASVH